MKRLLFVIISLVLLLTGCNNSTSSLFQSDNDDISDEAITMKSLAKKYEIYLIDAYLKNSLSDNVSDYIISLDKSLDCVPDNNTDNHEEKIIIDWKGKKTQLVYFPETNQKYRNPKWCEYILNTYEEDEEKNLSVKTYKSGDKTHIFSIYDYSPFLREDNISDIGADNRLAKIHEYVKKYINVDLSKYEITQKDKIEKKTSEDVPMIYSYSFEKKADGMSLHEFVNVNITADGEPTYISSTNAGRFDGVDLSEYKEDYGQMQKLCKEALEKILENKKDLMVDEIYEPTFFGYKGNIGIYVSFSYKDTSDPLYQTTNYGSFAFIPKQM